MTLPAVSQLANLKQSFEVYIAAQFGSSFADSDQGIDYDGIAFNDAGLREWIQPRLVGPARPDSMFYRQVPVSPVSPAGRGQGLVVICQVNIFVRPQMEQSAGRLAHRLHQLRDLVLASLIEYKHIAVLDYTQPVGSQTALGDMIVRRVNGDMEIPTREDDMRQWLVSVECDWTEVY